MLVFDNGDKSKSIKVIETFLFYIHISYVPNVRFIVYYVVL